MPAATLVLRKKGNWVRRRVRIGILREDIWEAGRHGEAVSEGIFRFQIERHVEAPPVRHQEAVSAAMACVVYSLIGEGNRTFSTRQYPRLGPDVIRGCQQ